jgi:hypothetical protein
MLAKSEAPTAQPRSAEEPKVTASPTKALAGAAPKPQSAQAPRKSAPNPAARPAPVELAAAKPEAAPAPDPEPAAGQLQLNILPWGEVFVNGRSRGVSPPLRTLELPPGAHTVEVRNTTFPALTQRIEVRSGEPVRIRHQFR